MATWPYRPDLDIVVTTDEGSPVGSTIIWYDDSYGYGEFEPVGTAADHRRRGVAAAMLRFGLAREIKPCPINRKKSARLFHETAHQRAAHHPSMSRDVNALSGEVK